MTQRQILVNLQARGESSAGFVSTFLSEAGHVAASGVVRSAAKHEPIIAIAVPYGTRAGRRVLSIAYPVAQTALATLVRLTTLSDPHRVLLIDAHGNIVAGDPTPSGSTLGEANSRLAGLLNRRGLESSLAQAIEHARRFREPLSGLMIDLDQFKQINDTHGHETGDQVLRAVADTMRTVFRDRDVLGRRGGDEFLVLLPATDADGAGDACRRLHEHVDETDLLPQHADEVIALSVGAATSTTGDDLIRQADIAL